MQFIEKKRGIFSNFFPHNTAISNAACIFTTIERTMNDKLTCSDDAYHLRMSIKSNSFYGHSH